MKSTITISEFQMTAPELLPKLYQRMLRDIATGRLPDRRLPGEAGPRPWAVCDEERFCDQVQGTTHEQNGRQR